VAEWAAPGGAFVPGGAGARGMCAKYAKFGVLENVAQFVA
jgi:hypothetical protein